MEAMRFELTRVGTSRNVYMRGEWYPFGFRLGTPICGHSQARITPGVSFDEQALWSILSALRGEMAGWQEPLPIWGTAAELPGQGTLGV
jgi:hypothetical protein